ncbi:MAG: J domain-containing protein [Phycisphaerae bacterium]
MAGERTGVRTRRWQPNGRAGECPDAATTAGNPWYNVHMSTEDPYKLLGVSRKASLQEIRLAYRHLALKVHPDSRPEDPKNAAKRFHELTMAYKAASHAAQRGEIHRGSFRNGEGRRYTPGDLAREYESAVRAAERSGVSEADPVAHADVPFLRKVSIPTLNEPAAFVVMWAGAVLLGVAVTGIVASGMDLASEPDWTEWGWLVGVSAAAYLLAVAAAVMALLFTRRVVWMAYQLTVWARRALPGAVQEKALPKLLELLRIGRK